MLFISFLLFAQAVLTAKLPYERSLFGAPGKDTVVADLVDGYQILGDTSKPARDDSRHIKNAKYTATIEDGDYPYPGHDLNGEWKDHPSTGTCGWQKLLDEASAISKAFARSDITQDKTYWHPAAPQQFYSTWDELDKAPRKKVRYTLTPKYNRHYGHAFLPPGESCKFTIKKAAINKTTVAINKMMSGIWTNPDGSPKFRQRLPVMDNQILLSNEVNYISSPYGGPFQFWYDGVDPIEIIVEGVIMGPYFKYGVHSDEEWENELRLLPGPVATIDTGNVHADVASKFIRDKIRMNDNTKFWRSAYQISQTAAHDSYQTWDIRVLNIVEMHFETFIPAGSAVAFVGGNYCMLPPDWISDMASWDNLQNSPWGTMHEMNHHHQSSWANSQVDEMSNNVLNLLTFAQTNQASSNRNENGGLQDWPKFSSSYQALTLIDDSGLQLYAILLQFFGYKRMKKFIRVDQANLFYDKNDEQYGFRGAQLLKACRVFRRNLRYLFNFMNFNDTIIFSNHPSVQKELDNMNLPMFKPVTNAYATGFIVNGEKFETARPFRIPPFEYEIDFNATMGQRVDHKDWFGDHEFVSAKFENGRSGAWKNIGFGKYLLTPKSNFLDKEEVIVEYKDKKSGQVTQVVCKFEQTNNFCEYERYTNISYHDSILDAFKKYSNEIKNVDEPVVKAKFTSVYSPLEEIDSNGWLSITKGILTPPESTSYQFVVGADDQGLFYLSETPLSLDPTKDKDHLIVMQPTYNMDYNSCNRSAKINLDSSKRYYFALLIYNTPGEYNQGKGELGWTTNNGNNWNNVNSKWLRYKADVDDEKIFNNQFTPEFEDIPYLDLWEGKDFIYEDCSKFIVYKYPKGQAVYNSSIGQGNELNDSTISEVLRDHNPNTEFRTFWWDGPIPDFPHVYEIDFTENRKIKDLKIGLSANPGWFGMNSLIEISLAPYNYSIVIDENTSIPYKSSNYSIDHSEAIIYKGTLNQSNYIYHFSNGVQGRYLRLNILNNTLLWKDGLIGRSSISAIELGNTIETKKVIPTTNTKLISFKDCTETQDGVYWNGKGMKCPTGSVITVKPEKGKKQIGILGDLHTDMGKATVRLNGQISDYINNSLITEADKTRLEISSRSHKQILYFKDINTGQANTVEVTVDQGTIYIAGLLYDDKLQFVPPTEELERDDFKDYLDYLDSLSGGGKKKSNAGKTAGIVIGVLLIIGAIVALVITQLKFDWFSNVKTFFGGLFTKENKSISTLSTKFDI